MIQFEIRPAIANDLSFIYDSFRQSMMNNSYFGRSCKNSLFNREFPKIIDYILSRSKVLVASASEDSNVIYGYIIYEPEVLHYAFVKESCWNLGIFKRLYHTAFYKDHKVYVSLITNMGKKIIHKFNKLEINPFILLNRGVKDGPKI